MSKSTVLHARIDSDLKDSVERILEQLGLTSSDAIKLFYKQVQLKGGLPFEVKIPAKVLAEQRLLAELEAGTKSAEESGWLSIEDCKAKLGI